MNQCNRDASVEGVDVVRDALRISKETRLMEDIVKHTAPIRISLFPSRNRQTQALLDLIVKDNQEHDLKVKIIGKNTMSLIEYFNDKCSA